MSEKICGIYMIRNLITDEKYIGQSYDINNRIKEHINHKNLLVGKNIDFYGIENFEITILCRCNNQNELDYFEDYYIQFFNSNEFLYGYNIKRGGQHNIGESNSNSKLTEQDIYDIREQYKLHVKSKDAYIYYKDKISYNYFMNIWEGKSWKNIHYDVYTDNNKIYYSTQTSIGENSYSALFTDNEVLELRKMYTSKSAKEIYQLINEKCSFQTLQQILWGRYYSHLPIYNKKIKKWINK